MSVIFILVTVSLLMASLFLILFLLSLKKGQYDDEESPPLRMLLDDISHYKNKQ